MKRAESPSSPLRTFENVPSPVSSLSSLELEDKFTSKRRSSVNSIGANGNTATPIQKQPLLKSKTGKEPINYPRRESLKIKQTVVMAIDKGTSQSSPTINPNHRSTPSYIDLYNNGVNKDYHMELVAKDCSQSNKKKGALSKIIEKVEKEKPMKPSKEGIFSGSSSFTRRASLKDNTKLEEMKEKKKEKEAEEMAKKYSKELEKKQQKEKEALRKKSKKEAKREKKGKEN